MCKNLWIAVVLAFWALAGCGGVASVTGGTAGTLRVGGVLLSDIQVTVHRVEGNSIQPVGFGITDADGKFQLVTSRAQGPLRLAAGDYRCTLESAGAPVEIPHELTRAETTSLKVSRASSDENLELVVVDSMTMQ